MIGFVFVGSLIVERLVIAYPLMSLDQIAIELQSPFSKTNLGHQPLDNISATIERNLLGELKFKQSNAL